MRICWDNIDGLRLTKHGKFKKHTVTYIEMDSCKQCEHPYLTESSRPSIFCGHACYRKGAKHTKSTKLLLSKLNKGANNPNYGVKASVETRLKMSKSRREENHPLFGKRHSTGTRKKMSESRKYVVYTDEWRKNLSKARKGNKNPFYGKKHSKEAKRKLASYKGSLSSGWKGGISCEPYGCDWTKKLKMCVKKRDHHKCMNPACHRKVKRLSVHHIDYNKKNCNLENLITLCNSCNSMANKNRAWHKVWYKVIMLKRYNYKY